MKPRCTLPTLKSNLVTLLNGKAKEHPGRRWLPTKRFVILSLLALFMLANIGIIVAQEVNQPTAPPESAVGLATFGERCANCHGPLGMGDGELSANLPNPPRVFGDTEFIREAVPTDLFETLTNGRIDMGMPPFGPTSSNPLSEESRWEAIAAVYSLGTPVESVEQGEAVYKENCLACHGQTGEGDGDEAADLSSAPPALTNLTYWSSTSNQSVFDNLSNPNQDSAHDYDLQDDDLWAVVDYIRTFSYGYSDPQAAFRPLETATVSGIVTNGTTSEPAPPDTAVRLRAFTSDLNVTLTMTATVDTEGRYQFDLTDVPQDWFFRTAIFYNEVEFGSDFDQVSLANADLELPIIIYEKTADSANITINQLHTILSFPTSGEVEVNQLYVVGNSGNTVYAGSSGDITKGTFEFALPSNAQLLEFQRGFGTLDSFFPTEELIPTTNGWSDTLPVRPGQGTLVLLARYTLPYDDGATISHPLLYETIESNLVVPEGIEVTGSDNWQDTGLQTLENGTFATYTQANLPAQSTLTAALEGRPSQTAGAVGPTPRNEMAEILVGGGIFLIVIAVAVFAVRQWQVPAYSIDHQKADLLQDIADLDDEYGAGELSENDYLEERATLIAELKAIWTE